MPPPTVLRKRHTLVGRGLLQLSKRFKKAVADPPAQLARPKMNKNLDSLDETDMQLLYRQISGGSEKDIFDVADISYTEENFRLLIHATIVYANEVGHPIGQELDHGAESDTNL